MILWEYFIQLIDVIVRDPFTQITGFMWMAVILMAYLQKDDTSVKKLMLLSSLFWGTHFYLLGVYSGLAAVIIWIIRLCLSIKYEKSKNAFLFIFCITIMTGFFTFDGILSLLPIITSITGAYGYFFFKGLQLRYIMLFNSGTWLCYNFFIGSVSGVINESLVQIILIATIYRMMHPEWGTHYYANKIKQILWKTRRPDYDRFVFIHDRVSSYRKKLWTHFHQILHTDLRKCIPKKKTKISEVLSS